jgi:hypothetical protein
MCILDSTCDIFQQTNTAFYDYIKVSRHHLSGGQTRVHGGVMVWLQQFFFLFFSLLSLLASGFMSALPKIKCVMLSLYLYQFYPHSFNYYLLCFQCFLKLFFIQFHPLTFYFI